MFQDGVVRREAGPQNANGASWAMANLSQLRPTSQAVVEMGIPLWVKERKNAKNRQQGVAFGGDAT